MPLREALIEAGRDPAAPDPHDDARADRRHDPGGASGTARARDFRAPLGRAVIGGVITSTLLTLLVIPTVYEILDDFREWVLAKFGRRVAHQRPTGVPAPAE